MKKLLLSLLTAFATSVYADSIATNGRDSVIIQSSACPAVVTQHIPAEMQPRYKSALANIDGTEYLACWTETGGYVFLVFEDGDTGIVSERVFRPLKEV